MSANRLLQAALRAAQKGWHVLPIWWPNTDGTCACGLPECKSVAKHPIAALVGNGQTSASTDEATIRSWWEHFPKANLAAVMVPSGLIAFDVDIYKGDDEKLAALIAEHGPLPETAEQISGSGEGVHLLYRSPGIPIRGQIGGITLRGRNYILLAPSRHKSGKEYTWESEVEPAHLPPAWVKAIAKADADLEMSPTIPTEEEEPDWLRAITQARRIALMQEHVRREEGEKMGVSRPGMMFDIARTAARGFGIRNGAAVFEALKELNDRCTPPYSLDKIADRVVAAYEKATTPTWGDALHGEAVLALTVPHAGEPAPPTETAFLAGLRARVRHYTNSKSPDEQHRRAVMDQVLKYKIGRPQITDPAEVLYATETLVREAIPGTTNDQIAAALLGLINTEATLGTPTTGEDLIAFAQRVRETIDPTAESVRPANDGELMARLIATNKGPKACYSNIEMILRDCEAFRDRIAWNVLSREVEIDIGGGVMASAAKVGTLDVALCVWLEKAWGIFASAEMVGKVLLHVAQNWGSYDPVADYLDGLVWDGKKRIDTWLQDHCSVEDSSYTRKIARRWLVSGAARGLKPGTKVDTVLILKGAQGLKKSSVFDVLGGDWFSDSPLDLGNKDARISASATWVIELAELAALGYRELESNKAFLAQRKDKVRPPYGRQDVVFQRHCIFGATTNALQFLIDDSGNRRWWTAHVTGEINLHRLRCERDQLWAEAVHVYREAMTYVEKGAIPPEDLRWWFEGKEQIEADVEAQKSEVEDPWVPLIQTWADQQTQLTSKALGLPSPASVSQWPMHTIAKGALDMSPTEMNKQLKALGAALRRAGLVQVTVRVNNRATKMWTRPTDTIAVEDLSDEEEEHGQQPFAEA